MSLANDLLQQMVSIKRMTDSVAAIDERTRILSLIDNLIHDTEDCPLYEGEEREWLLSAYRNVRRVVNAVNQDLPRHPDTDLSPGQASAPGVEGD